MNRLICFAVFIFFHTSPTILGQTPRILNIAGNENNAEVPVWTGDNVEIIARYIAILRWLFNNVEIAILNESSGDYTYPNNSNTPVSININATAREDASLLTLGNVSRAYNGTYQAVEDPGTYSLSMIVHGNNLWKFIHIVVKFLFL
jgi:hypothetical protein